MGPEVKKAAVFEETYQNYLKQLAGIDCLARADVLGAKVSGNALAIDFYGDTYNVSAAGVTDARGKRANFAVSVVLCKYILVCPEEVVPDGIWVTYREFKDAGPLTGYFNSNTNKTIETTFSGRLDKLERASRRLGATAVEDGAAYDLSLAFKALPRIPVLLRFNDGDAEFPAQCSILFRRSAEHYLDMESLAIAGTFLTGNLIRE
ncbi:MAG: DUF3786 domain-containing protein [Deltaproteobacteria bacterium]|nr:DUF3786 domain-containing protein [Deltaproteobacteria bacterium]